MVCRPLLVLMFCSLLPAAVVIDHATVVESDADVDAELRARSRAAAIVVGMPRDGHDVYAGLQALADAKGEEFRTTRRANTAWLRKGGVVGLQRGNAREPVEQLADLAEKIGDIDAAAGLQVVMILLDDRAISDGSEPEFHRKITQRTTVLMGLETATAQLENMREKNIQGVGPGGGPVRLPIHEPQVAYGGVSTMGNAPTGQVTVEVERYPSQRQPGLAIAGYQAALDTIEAAHPRAVIVVATVPLAVTGNQQRVVFNDALRQVAAERGLPLFDIADILSHEPTGEAASDPTGPVLAPGWRQKVALNDAARLHLASLWWHCIDTVLAGMPAEPAAAAD